MLLKTIEDVIEESLCKSIERLILRVSQLQGFSELYLNSTNACKHRKERYGVVGLNTEMLKSLREMLESMLVGVESLLVDLNEAKLSYRSLLVFFNESVVRIAKQAATTGTPEIENCKNHLAKLTSQKECLLKLFSSKESFYMANISAHFDPKADETLKLRAGSAHLVLDPATGITYQRGLSHGETKGSWTKSQQLPLPRSVEFLAEYVPGSLI